MRSKINKPSRPGKPSGAGKPRSSASGNSNSKPGSRPSRPGKPAGTERTSGSKPTGPGKPRTSAPGSFGKPEGGTGRPTGKGRPGGSGRPSGPGKPRSTAPGSTGRSESGNPKSGRPTPVNKRSNFEKFINNKSNAVKKEELRQVKRKDRKETEEGIKETKARKAALRSHAPGAEPILDKKIGTPPNIKRQTEGEMPLNKFIAHAGICSRRDAAILVKDNAVKVNGNVVTEPGFKVTPQDEVKVNGKRVFPSKDLVYILLNKPKDYITTSEDPQGRKTVLDLIKNATPERVYPVGRLDRNTTGVLLLTNDGELAQKLAHPSFQVKKIYEVRLDKPLTKKDFDTIVAGVTLEDGFIAPDVLAYADSKDKSIIGIEIHSGKNRIVRRIFEHMQYDVKNLDRVMYANMTKKNVDRGHYRFLNEKEVRLLKFLNASFTRKKNDSKD